MATYLKNESRQLFFKFSFVILGFFSLITQTIFLRELFATLYGHEFFVGITLASWLTWVALGSLIGNRYALTPRTLKLIIVFPLLISFTLLGEILLLRYLKPFIWLFEARKRFEYSERIFTSG